MSNDNRTRSCSNRPALIDDLGRALDAVSVSITRIRPDQWLAPTPCVNWTVRALVDHLVGLNRVFTALITEQPAPQRPAAGHVEVDPIGAWVATSANLLAAFAADGVLDRVYQGPLGPATGADRLQIRLYDLLAHGWDLARATGQRVRLPEDVVERSLTFARRQVVEQARPGRFGAAQSVEGRAPAIDRLAAFLGRTVAQTQPSQ